MLVWPFGWEASSTAVFQRMSLSGERPDPLLLMAQGIDWLTGTGEESKSPEQAAPGLRRVPPRSGLLVGRSLLSALAKERDRPRVLGAVKLVRPWAVTEIGREEEGTLDVEDITAHILGRSKDASDR